MLLITDELKVEYLSKHLPYRINSMLAHSLIMHRKTQPEFRELRDTAYSDSTVVEPIFEISTIFGRTLLHFLGIGIDSTGLNIDRAKIRKGKDLTIQSIFPERNLCPLDDSIIVENSSGLLMVLKLANKSVAHLTIEITNTTSEDQSILPAGLMAICKLLLKHVPEIDVEKIWWHSQVEELHCT